MRGGRALAGSADARASAVRRRRNCLVGDGGTSNRGPARSRSSCDAGTAARLREAACCAIFERQRIDQPDARRTCAFQPWRSDPAHHRRRPNDARHRIHNHCIDRRWAAPPQLGPIEVQAETRSGSTIEAPGQLASHYAPSKPLRLNATSADPTEYLIGFGTVEGEANLSPTGDLAEAASRLFDLLHNADASHKKRIAMAPVPDEGLGAAINDRLRRAAANR